MSDTPGLSRRGLARRLAMQAVYQWIVNETPPGTILRQFREQPDGLGRADPAYFELLLRGVLGDVVQLREAIIPHLDRPLEQLDPVEHAVVLVAAYELVHEPGVPWKVVVNEAVQLTKLFGAEDGFKFVNGVLDQLARTVRPLEIGAAGHG
jgi:transcription antitermination factor NusB